MISEQKVKVIGRNIRDSFKQHGIDVKIQYTNNYKVIAIDDKRGIQLWLRLYPSGDQINADISTIELPVEIRRKDIFNTMCKRLKNSKYINHLRITGVCTPEMMNFCKKHNFKEISPSDFLVDFK